MPTLPENDEFQVFEDADANRLLDSVGNLFGLLRDGEGGLRDLGTRGEQVAKFWLPPVGSPWHGFPAFPLNDDTIMQNRKG